MTLGIIISTINLNALNKTKGVKNELFKCNKSRVKTIFIV